jgi:hypothetical protein
MAWKTPGISAIRMGVDPGGYFSISLEAVDFINIQVQFRFAEPDTIHLGLCDPELLSYRTPHMQIDQMWHKN